MIIIDPVTRQRVVVSENSGDFQYLLTGDDAIAKEDVPVIGPWADYTGSDINVQTKNQVNYASKENSLQGQDAQIVDNAKLPNLSVIGTRKETNRRRLILLS